MGIDRLYRVCCDFCHIAGPTRSSEVEAVKAAGVVVRGTDCNKRIKRVHVSFYGNEVWACERCLETDAEAQQWAAMPQGKEG